MDLCGTGVFFQSWLCERHCNTCRVPLYSVRFLFHSDILIPVFICSSFTTSLIIDTNKDFLNKEVAKSFSIFIRLLSMLTRCRTAWYSFYKGGQLKRNQAKTQNTMIEESRKNPFPRSSIDDTNLHRHVVQKNLN